MGFFSKVWKGVKKVGSGLLKGVTSIPGKLIGGAVDLGSAWLQNKYIQQPAANVASDRAFENSAYAFQKSREAYQNRYQDTYTDMLKAGLNPILAASGGFNVGNSPQMSNASAFQANNTNIQGSSSYASIQEGKHREEQIAETQAKAVKTIAEARVLLKEIALKTAQIAKTRAEKGLIEESERLAIAQISETYGKLGKIFHEITKLGAVTDLTKEQTEIVKQNLKILQQNFLMLEKKSQWYKGAYGQFLGWLKATSGALGINMGVILPTKGKR